MKKFIAGLLVVSIVVFAISCAKEEIIPTSNSHISTRSILDGQEDTWEETLAQFADTPLNIMSPAGRIADESLYLTFEQSSSVYQLEPPRIKSKLEGIDKLRQQFYIRKSDENERWLISSALTDLTSNELENIFGSQYTLFDEYAVMVHSANFDLLYFYPGVPNPQKSSSVEHIANKAGYYRINFPQFEKFEYIRYPYGGGGLMSEVGYKGIYGEFIFSPAQDFEIVSVTYRIRSEDGAFPRPDFMDEILVENNSPREQNMSVQFTRKATESSSFSEANGISMTESSSFSVGIPKIGIGGGLDVSNTSSASWTFGDTQSKEDSRSYTFNLFVPGNSIYRATVSVAMYDAICEYEAVYRGNISGNDIRLRGEWSGIAAGLITYKIYDVSGNLLRTFTPQELNYSNIIDMR